MRFKEIVSVLLCMFLMVPAVFAAPSKLPPEGKYHKVINVSYKRGDFSDVQAAYDSVVEATQAAPVLIKIAPGVYNFDRLSFGRNFIDVQGSGQGVTILRSTVSNYEPSTWVFVATTGENKIMDLSFELNALESQQDHTTNALYIESQGNTVIRNVDVRYDDANSGSAHGMHIRKLFGARATLDNVSINMHTNSPNYTVGGSVTFGFVDINNFNLIVNAPNSSDVTGFKAGSGIVNMTGCRINAIGNGITRGLHAGSDLTFEANYNLSQCEISGNTGVSTGYLANRTQNDYVNISNSVIDGQIIDGLYTYHKKVLNLTDCTDSLGNPI